MWRGMFCRRADLLLLFEGPCEGWSRRCKDALAVMKSDSVRVLLRDEEVILHLGEGESRSVLRVDIVSGEFDQITQIRVRGTAPIAGIEDIARNKARRLVNEFRLKLPAGRTPGEALRSLL
jgi:hypothetical protein